mgnify:CR=1 FL=1
MCNKNFPSNINSSWLQKWTVTSLGIVFEAEMNISRSKSEANMHHGVTPQILLPLKKYSKFAKRLRKSSIKGKYCRVFVYLPQFGATNLPIYKRKRYALRTRSIEQNEKFRAMRSGKSRNRSIIYTIK